MLRRSVDPIERRTNHHGTYIMVAIVTAFAMVAVGLEVSHEAKLQRQADKLALVCADVRDRLCDARDALRMEESHEPSLGVPLGLTNEIRACASDDLFDEWVYRQAVVHGDYETADWQMTRAIASIPMPITGGCKIVDDRSGIR